MLFHFSLLPITQSKITFFHKKDKCKSFVNNNEHFEFFLEDISKTRTQIKTLITKLRNMLKKVINNKVIVIIIKIHPKNKNQDSMYLLTNTVEAIKQNTIT